MAKGKGKSRGFPESYRAMAPGARLSWLGGADCKDLIDQGRLQASNVQAEVLRLERQRLRISRIAPTPSRVSDYLEGEPFPPRGPCYTPMREADIVLNPSVEAEVLWPRNYLKGTRGQVAIYDVIVFEDQLRQQRLDMRGSWDEDDEPTTESPSGRAIQRMSDNEERIVEQKLAPEDAASLQGEIDHYLATGEVVHEATIDLSVPPPSNFERSVR